MPFAWLIMKAYDISYDHVYIRFYSDKFARNLVYQSSKTMVNFIEFNNFCEANEIVKEFEVAITEIGRTKMIQFAVDNVGKPYGIKNALGLAIVKLCSFFNKKIRNPFSDAGKTYVCCELVAEILKEYTPTKIDQDINSINPKELYDILYGLYYIPQNN